jgi:hypothetical protein
MRLAGLCGVTIISIWMSGGWKSPAQEAANSCSKQFPSFIYDNGEGGTNHSLNRHLLEGKGEGIFMGESADNQLIIS